MRTETYVTIFKAITCKNLDHDAYYEVYAIDSTVFTSGNSYQVLEYNTRLDEIRIKLSDSDSLWIPVSFVKESRKVVTTLFDGWNPKAM